MDSQEPKKSNVRFIALRCIFFELSACENLAEFPAESGCKANDLTRYKVAISHSTLYLIEVSHDHDSCLRQLDMLLLDVG